MNETLPRAAIRAAKTNLVWLALPLIALAIAVAWILSADPLSGFRNGAPPVENLTFERTVLDDSGLRLLVRAGGSEPMTVAQVQVDDAYWQFTQDPPGPIARGKAAWLSLPFPWMLGEAHALKVVTNTGATFAHDIAVAVPTPQATAGQLRLQALVGIIVGIVPVAVGLMFYPLLRGVGQAGMAFLLSLTIGLLAFLLIDASAEALELASQAAAIFQGPVMVVLAGLGSFLLLMAIGRRGGVPTGLALSTYIALGIGLHNLGEGLAIGAAFAAGSAGLGTFLVLGFALHNVTEGIGIAAPILKQRPSLWVFVRPDAACRRAGGDRHVARQPGNVGAMVGAGAGDRGRRDPAGDRRGQRLPDAPERKADRGPPDAARHERARCRRRLHVRDRGSGENLIVCGSLS